MRTSASVLQALALVGLPLMVNAHEHGHEAAARSAKVQYVPNHGQWDASVRFKAAFPISAMFLQDDGVTWVRMQDDAADRVHDYIQWTEEEQADFSLRGHAWRMRFVGADTKAVKHGEERRREYHNYFLGSDARKWAGGVPVFEGVRYERLWPGIDLRWHSAEAQVKYDLLLAPGADASSIGFAYEGLDGIGVNPEGNLELRTSVATLTEMRPVAWYADDRSALACAFELKDGVVGFRFPDGADHSRAIVIDPMLMGATYSGQVGASNYGHCSTFDAAGHIYGGAQNFGVGFPSTLGAFQTSPAGGAGTDIVLNKFTPDATQLIWATYVGSPSDDKPHSMIVNNANEICVLGSSTGAGFPTTSGAFDGTFNGASDIVVFHLNSTATAMVGSTYLGGAQQDGRQSMTNNYGDTYRGEIMLDAASAIYIASSTQSADFPVTAGAFQATHGGGQDALIAGLTPDCSALITSTYIGGSSDDAGLGMRFDGVGGMYLCGTTASSNFPMVSGGYQSTYQGGNKDAFVVRLSDDGSQMLAGTFFGTSSADAAYFIDLDNDNDVHIYGQSSGSIAIEPAGIYGQSGTQVFLASFNPELSSTIYTTTVGGSNLAPVAFLVDHCERIYISGYNPNGAWETTPDALYQQGFSQFYLACYDVDMSGILFGTYYGGSHVDGGTSRFDKAGIIYQGVCSGGNSMPTTSDAYAPNNNVSWDLGVFKIDFQQSGVVANVGASALSGCAPSPIDFTAIGNAPTYVWDLGDGTTATGQNVSHLYTETGTYVVMLVGLDSTSCNIADTAYVTINISDPAELLAAFTSEPLSSCDGYAVQLNSTSVGGNLLWDLGGGFQTSIPAPLVDVGAPGTYSFTLMVIDPICVDTAVTSMTVVVPPASMTIDLPSPAYICPNTVALLSAGAGYDSYLWSTGEPTQIIEVDEPGFYSVEVTDGFCMAADSIEVLVAPVQARMEDVTACPGSSVRLSPPFTPTSITWSTGSDLNHIFTDVAGPYWFAATDAYGCMVLDTVDVHLFTVVDGSAEVPNVFTPNGDGVNDVFAVNAPNAGDFSMEVYNRWGQLMYRSNSVWNGWKGSVDNELDKNVPDGTYFYIVTYTDPCATDPDVNKAGHVTLLR